MILAISIFVPTPSVHATIFGFLIFFGISLNRTKSTNIIKLFFAFFFDDIFEMNFTNLSAALISTPLFLYVNRVFIHYYKMMFKFKITHSKFLYIFFLFLSLTIFFFPQIKTNAKVFDIKILKYLNHLRLILIKMM